MSCDVILDSGADTSVLPLRYGSIGEVGPAPNTVFVDAQGRPLAVVSTRVATLQFGDVAFKEKFIVSDVATPLVALGHIIRAGWNLVQGDSSPCLVKVQKASKFIDEPPHVYFAAPKSPERSCAYKLIYHYHFTSIIHCIIRV